VIRVERYKSSRLEKLGFRGGAIAFCLRGPELTLSFELYSPTVGERQMWFDHLPHLRADDLMLLDRGDPARSVIAALYQRDLHFCMRVDDTGLVAVKAFRRSGQREAVIQIAPPSKQDAKDFGVARKPTTVRLIRGVTPNGNGHVVITSLLDASTYPAADFADLYRARWRIEKAFNRIKHRLK
jgi:hypothetical protein